MVSISDTVKYIGVDDTDITHFENQYPVPHGISYNSYIVCGEKTAIMDSVEARFAQEWFAKIAAATPSVTPDYLVVQHMEPDHSGSIAAAMSRWQNMQLVCTRQAAAMLKRFFPDEEYTTRIIPVKEGDTLDLGGRKLTFIMAPMVHWPEVMVTFDDKDSVLFTADAFGKFGVPGYEDGWVDEARRYYINIVGKYGVQVQNLLRKAKSLPVKILAPLHGVVLNSDLERYLGLYDTWSSYRAETPGVLIAYASIYGGTQEVALELADMLEKRGVSPVIPFNLSREDVSEAVSQAFRMKTTVLASVTYDAGLFPPMLGFLERLKCKNFQNRNIAIVQNGSWAPVAGKLMTDFVSSLSCINIVGQTVTVPSRLEETSRAQLEQLADAIAAEAVNG